MDACLIHTLTNAGWRLCSEPPATDTPEAAGGIDAGVPQRATTARLKGTLIHVLREENRRKHIIQHALEPEDVKNVTVSFINS